MNDTIFKLGNFSLYGFGLLSTLAFLWGSFVFYKKAVESHFEEMHILDGVVVGAFWAFIMGRLSYVVLNYQTFWNHLPRIFLFSNFPGIDRWGVLLGIFLGVLWTVRRVKGKVMDWFDLVSLGVTAGMSIFFAGLSLVSLSWQFAIVSFLLLFFFLWFWSVEEKYRTFGWYKANKTSAKSGFILGFSLSIWGTAYLVEQILNNGVGLWEAIWSAGLFVGGLVLVYIRSGRTVAEDIKTILKHGRK